MSRRRATDDCLYEPEAVRVGLLLFPGRVCSTCGATLPANSDYFVWDRTRDGYASGCRRCRRDAERKRGRSRAAKT